MEDDLSAQVRKQYSFIGSWRKFCMLENYILNNFLLKFGLG